MRAASNLFNLSKNGIHLEWTSCLLCCPVILVTRRQESSQDANTRLSRESMRRMQLRKRMCGLDCWPVMTFPTLLIQKRATSSTQTTEWLQKEMSMVSVTPLPSAIELHASASYFKSWLILRNLSEWEKFRRWQTTFSISKQENLYHRCWSVCRKRVKKFFLKSK